MKLESTTQLNKSTKIREYIKKQIKKLYCLIFKNLSTKYKPNTEV